MCTWWARRVIGAACDWCGLGRCCNLTDMPQRTFLEERPQTAVRRPGVEGAPHVRYEDLLLEPHLAHQRCGNVCSGLRQRDPETREGWVGQCSRAWAGQSRSEAKGSAKGECKGRRGVDGPVAINLMFSSGERCIFLI